MDKSKAIKIIEHHLRNYKTYKIGIKNLQKSLDDILPQITTNYTLREGTSGSFDITSNVETAVLDRVEGSRAIYLREQMLELQRIVDSIDEAVEALGEDEKRFFTLRYFEGHSIEKTSQNINHSVQNCFKIRNQVMNKFLISLRNIIRSSVEF
jgi:DNA-directed RNA polymerase specialized sigma24 family protein